MAARVARLPVLEMIPRPKPACRRLFSNACASGSQARGDLVTNVSPRSKKITRMAMAVAPLLGVGGTATPLVDSDER